MSNTKTDLRQTKYVGSIDQLSTTQVTEGDNIVKSINDDLTSLLRLSANTPASLVVNVGGSDLLNSESGRRRAISHIGKTYISFSSGTVTFPASSGGNIVCSPGSSTVLNCPSGQFSAVLIYLNATGGLSALAGAPNASSAAAISSLPPAPSKTLAIGFVLVQNVGGTIQNISNGSIRQFSSGSGSSASGTGTGVGSDLDSLVYRAEFSDTFEDLPSDAVSAVDYSAGRTDANTYDIVNGYHRLAYDASRTVTGTGTAMTLSAAPTFTIKAGDILVVGNEARRITVITSQTVFTIESAFTSNPSGAACTVSQAVYTKDLNNFAVDGLATSSVYSTNIEEALLIYEDTEAANDIIFDNGVPAHIAAAISSDGSAYTEKLTRTTSLASTAQATTIAPAGANLFIRFFSNKTTGSGFVNVLGYKIYFHKEAINFNLLDGYEIANSEIVNPTRLDVKKDTEANLIAYAVSATNGQLVFATDTKKMYQVLDGGLVSVGSGAGSSLDTFFTQTFEEAQIADFSQVGLVLDTTPGDLINGEVTARLVHQPVTDQFFRQTIDLANKYRGTNLSFSLFVRSNASAGNVVFSVRDMTNSTDLVLNQALTLGAGLAGAQNVVSFDVPETCQQIRYEVKALQQSGSPETFVDDITGYLTQSEVVQSVLVQEVDSEIRLTGGTFTGPSVASFTTVVSNRGSAIQFNGTNRLTALEAGIYTFTTYFSQNGATVITPIIRLNGSLVYSGDTTNLNTHVSSASVSLYLNVNDYIEVLNISSGNGNNGTLVATKEGKLKQVNVNPNSKITIPTSELRMEGASTRGSTATAIVRFDNVASLRGDAFTVVSDAVNGTAITMLKAGKLTATVNLALSNNQGALTLNQSNLTAVPLSVSSEILASSYYNVAAVGNYNYNWTGSVRVGDVIRFSAGVSPTPAAMNNLVLYFQEQDIAVAVTNIQPKFSEADSSVRLDIANGYGSIGTRIRRFSNIRENFGTDIQYVDSATDGASFRILSDGIYSVNYTDEFNANANFGISKNASSLSANYDTLTPSQRLSPTGAFANAPGMSSWTGYLVAGDIIRAHSAGNPTGDSDNASFTISKVGKPNITSVDVTPFIEIPQPQQQSGYITGASIGGNSNFTGALTSSFGNGIYSYNSTTGVYTMLKQAKVNLIAGIDSNGSGISTAGIRVDGAVVGGDSNAASPAGSGATTTWSGILQANQTIELRNLSGNAGGTFRGSILAEALSDQILTEPETFSSDTAQFVYAPSSTYTLTTLANAPVGTFITFTYAANTNTRTQTTTAPTQTVGDMNVNGVRIFARPYNATSTAAQPAAFSVQIGRGLKGKSLDLYKNIGKVTGGSLDFYEDTGFTTGALVIYNETTGVLTVDAGRTAIVANGHTFIFEDNSQQTDGYVVINASKNPALVGLNAGEAPVVASYFLSANQAVTANVTRVNFDSRIVDPYNAVTTGVNWAFVVPPGKAGVYEFAVTTATTSTIVLGLLFKNGSLLSTITRSEGGVLVTGIVVDTAVPGDSYWIIPSATLTLTGGARNSQFVCQFNVKRINPTN